MTDRYEGPVLCLMGPTASGKTEVAIRLTRAFPARIISVDSALVYRGMDIGTAKPDAHMLGQYPHALVDIRDPHQTYSAADFCTDAAAEIEQARTDGLVPLLVGGTMLYFRALRDGLAALPAADRAVRAEIDALARQAGWPAVHARLQAVDPETAERLKPTDSQRLQRALEVFEITGVPLSAWHARAESGGLGNDLLQIGLIPDDRAWLHARIHARFEQMLAAGFEAEVRRLHGQAGLHADLPSMRCVGYRQLWQWLDGESTFTQACDAARAATRQLAKRQLTWLRSWPDLTRIPVGAPYDAPAVTGAALAALQEFGPGPWS